MTIHYKLTGEPEAHRSVHGAPLAEPARYATVGIGLDFAKIQQCDSNRCVDASLAVASTVETRFREKSRVLKTCLDAGLKETERFDDIITLKLKR